jgi:small-conductance mechanosensitive channel
MKIIQEHAENHPLMIDVRTEQDKAEGKPAVSVACVNLGDFSVDLRVNVHTKTAADGAVLSSDLRMSVKEAFEKDGINIPFPTMQIHSETSQK